MTFKVQTWLVRRLGTAAALAVSVSMFVAEASAEETPAVPIVDAVPAPVVAAPEVAPAPAPAPEVKPEPKPGTEVTFLAAPGSGLTFKAGDAFSLNIRTRIQLRYQIAIPSNGIVAGGRTPSDIDQLVGVGTARLYFSGNALTPKLTYLVQLAIASRDFRDGAISPVYDAYIDYAVNKNLKIRVGQYFVPFDRLRTVREWGLELAERPRPVNEFHLDRDTGIMLYSDRYVKDGSPIAWYLGAFGGGGNNLTTGRAPGALAVARLELRPLAAIDDDKEGDLARRVKPALALGIAGAANINTNRQRSTTGATYRGGSTDYFHAATDAVFKWRGLAAEAEYIARWASSETINYTDATGAAAVATTRPGHGWIAQASYVFRTPVQIVGRLSGTYAFKDADPAFVTESKRFGNEVGAGINYYFNEHKLKTQLTWIARMPYGYEFNKAAHGLSLLVDATF